jgi:hypothetical protein
MALFLHAFSILRRRSLLRRFVDSVVNSMAMKRRSCQMTKSELADLVYAFVKASELVKEHIIYNALLFQKRG